MVEIVLEAFQSSSKETYLDDLGLEHLLMGLQNVKDLKMDDNLERRVKRDVQATDRTLKDILGIVNALAEKVGIGQDF